MEFARRWDPQPGDIVSFKHHGYLMASKKPKLPTLYRLRKDLQWDDVINGWKEQAPLKPGELQVVVVVVGCCALWCYIELKRYSH